MTKNDPLEGQNFGIAPQGGPNGVNHISMYLGYHNIKIKTRDILKLNFGIWMIDCMKRGLYVKMYFKVKNFYFKYFSNELNEKTALKK